MELRTPWFINAAIHTVSRCHHRRMWLDMYLQFRTIGQLVDQVQYAIPQFQVSGRTFFDFFDSFYD